jgi:hypothetical protein
MLDVWPPLPIVMRVYRRDQWGVDNTFVGLEHNDRICHLDLVRIPGLQLKRVLAALQRPFPELKGLWLRFEREATAVVPDSFLGGSSPRLQTLYLHSVPFPGLPKLLLSATNLVSLSLSNVSHSGYISPGAMATSLSVLTMLENLVIGFESPPCHPDLKSQLSPLPPRTLLPVLTGLKFSGAREYLEDLVARVDAPLLDNLWITFFHELILHTPYSPQLTQFISRTPNFKAHDEARVVFSDWDGSVVLPQTCGGALRLGVSCREDWKLSSLAQICRSSFPLALITAVEHLYIHEDEDTLWDWQDEIDDSEWLLLLHPFTGVKDLYISSRFTPLVASALQELVQERVTDVLPTLRTLFLEEPLPSGPVQEFVAARQLANHPISISGWEREGF